GGSTSCAPGVGFAQPATQAEITMLRAESGGTDTYDVEVINGLHVPIKMQPNATANNYQCGIPGNEIAENGFGACNWSQASPANSNAAAAVNKFYKVTRTGAKCLANRTCATQGLLCGLDENLNPGCGAFLGYYSANELCALNSNFASPFAEDNFSCKQNLSTPFPESTYPLSQLLACPVPKGSTANPRFNSCYLNYAAGVYTENELKQCCGCVNWWDIPGILANNNNNDPTFLCQTGSSSNAGNVLQVDPEWTRHVQPTIQWMKRACPSVYTYQFDDKTSTFTCTQPKNYTITFCPGGDTGLPQGITEGRG
ncbi:MAG: thaumatin family protein, partial [Legionellaceae bacterium]|nr:thaumatin family protein [Legionellaceae bacterium]